MYIADMHCDSIMILWLERRNGGKVLNNLRSGDDLQVDLLKMKEGGYLMQNFALYADLHIKDGTSPWTQFKEMAQIFHEEVDANSDLVRQARSYEDIMRNRDEGFLSAVMTVEEGGVLEGDLDRLPILYDEGVRMMTLTWNYENELGFPNEIPAGWEEDYSRYFKFVPRTDNGLKPKGFEAVERMQELGILVDVSHLSDAGFYDVAKAVKGPFVASHSNARVFAGCNRNMTDDMIRTVGEHGGVIGLNFCPDFLMEGPSEEACKCSPEVLIRNARHVMNVGGSAVLGLGTDFDGIGRNDLDPANASQMQKLVECFEQAGFSPSEIEGICWRNVMDVYKETLK